MKKLLLVGAFATFGVLALSSCKKDYKCVYNGTTISECTGCSKTQKTAFDSACTLSGGTVSEN